MGRVKNSMRNLIWGIVNKICTIIFPFIIRTFIIKMLGVEYLGLSSLFTSILQVLSLAELGISSAIVFSMYQPIAEKDTNTLCAIYNFYRRIYLVIGTVILIIGLLLMPFMPLLISGDIPVTINIYFLYGIYLLNTVISYFMSAYKECLLIANQRVDISTNILTVCYIIMYIVQMIILVLFKNYYLYVIALLLCTILINVIRSYIVDKKYPNIKCKGNIDISIKKQLKKKVVGLMFYKISNVCRNSFDSIVLSAFLGLAVLAKYQNYYYIMYSILGFCAIISSSITSSVGDSIASESINKNYIDFKGIALLYSWIAGWCATCLLCLFQPFMKIWMGEENMLSFSVVILICIYFYSLLTADMCYIYRQAAGLWWEDKFRPVCESVLNLLLNIVLVKKFGVAGVLLSTIISIVFLNIPWAAYILFKKYFKMPVKKYFKDVIIKALIVLFVCAITYFITTVIKINGVQEIIIKGIICLVVPNILFILAFKNISGYSKAKDIILKIIPKRFYKLAKIIF